MAAASRIEGDTYQNGNFTPKTFSPPAGCITDAAVVAAAGIAATKVDHQHREIITQTGSATSITQVIYRCYGATATLIEFAVGSIAIAIGGGANVTFDLKKNGTTVLSGVVTINASSVAYVGQTGTISVPGLVAGDVLSVVTVATAGGGTLPTGLFAAVTVNEKAQ